MFGATLNVLEPLAGAAGARRNADPRHLLLAPHAHLSFTDTAAWVRAARRADREVAGPDLENARRRFLHRSNAIVVDA